MQIEVRLFATLQQGRFRRKKLELPEGSTVADICRELAMEPHEVAIRAIDGTAVERDHPLQPGNAVSLFPPIGGG